jgi:5-methylcytosine-specific restriction endonuclease McrA
MSDYSNRRAFHQTLHETIYARAKGYCEYCGRDTLSSIDAMYLTAFDHIVPLSKGGKSDSHNAAFACKSCHYYKGVYVPRGETREAQIADAWNHFKDDKKVKDETAYKARLAQWRTAQTTDQAT